MAIQPDGPAPYAPAQTVIDVIVGYRERGFSTPFTPEVLIRAGVAETLVPRTLMSLKLLDLIDEGGHPTEQFESLRRARGEEEYKARLQEWLRAVYADVLQYTNPEVDPPERVSEAFRGYTPSGQRSRMVTLMLRLFALAGLIPEESLRSQSAPKSGGGGRRRHAASPVRTRQHPKPQPSRNVESAGELPPALVGLLRQIPTAGDGWTKATRDHFLAAFTAVLDFTVPVRQPGVDDLMDEDSDVPGDPEDDL